MPSGLTRVIFAIVTFPVRSALRRMAGELGKLSLLGKLAAHEGGERLRRILGRDCHAERLDALTERGGVDRVVEVLVEQGDDRGRRLAGRGEADEAAVIEAGIALLGHGR